MSKKQKRYGRQEPTFAAVGSYDFSYGSAIEEWFGSYGIKLAPYQSYQLELYGARTIDDDGEEHIAGSKICCAAERQIGKSFSLRLYIFFMAAFFNKICLFTAHNYKTAKINFKWLVNFVKAHSELEDMLLESGGIKQSAVDTGFYFKNGGCIQFATRTASGVRGDSADIIAYDEAQELRPEHMEAISPLVVASGGHPQQIYIGTPPSPQCSGTTFKSYHDASHETPDDAPVWWFEWAIDYIPDDICDIEVYYSVNPALGYRIKETTLLDEAKTAESPEGFCREYLGYWSKGMQYKALIPDRLWDGCKVSKEEAAKIQGHVAYAVKFSVDGSSAAVAVCIRPDDKEEQRLVEIFRTYDMAQGLQPIVKFLVENDRAKNSLGVLIDGRSNAASLVNALADAGLKNKNLIIQASTGAYTEACSSFLNAINEKKVVHVGAPQLSDAVTQSMKRKVGNLGAWGFKSLSDAIDVSVVDAAALALYMANTSKRIRFSG